MQVLNLAFWTSLFASRLALPCSESIAAPVDDFKGGSISPKYKGEAEASPLSELAQT